VDLDELGAHWRARYCCAAHKVAEERSRRLERELGRRPVVVEPARAAFVSVVGEPGWSARFRRLVWVGDLAEARRVWDYQVAYEVARTRPSPVAVDVAHGLRLRVPEVWEL
jgi:hypothetical protein